MLTETKPKELTTLEKLECLEDHFLDLPQVECPVVHHFGPGIYIREVHLPAGIFAVGHYQKFEQMNIVLKGSVITTNSDGEQVIIRSPSIFVGPPGRKFGYVLEDTIWQNVYSTEETDIEKLEEMLLDKSKTWNGHNDALQASLIKAHECDREDYRRFLSEFGLDDEMIRIQSENESDLIDLPREYLSIISVRESPIEGKGIFVSYPVKAGEIIGPGRLNGKRTQIGRFTNHSTTPNAEFKEADNGDIFLISTREIRGCLGGDPGEEVTVDYRDTPLANMFRRVG